MDWTRLPSYILIAFGAYLVADSLYLHWLYFDYQAAGLSWFKPTFLLATGGLEFHHWIVGLILIGVGLLALGIVRVGDEE